MEIMVEQEPKERIISHAEDRFLRNGFNKVTLDELSSELGISKKTMYKFFPSKEYLVRTIIRLLMGRMEQEITRITEAEKPFVQKLADLLMLIGTFASRISRSFQVDMQRFAPTLWKEIDKFRNEKILSRVAKMIADAKKEGIFRDDINEQIVIMMFVNSVQSIANPEVLSQHSFSPKEAMYTIFHVIFEGSLTEEARKEFLKCEITIL